MATDRHLYYTPADCAALLGGVPHGDAWRARCPVHGGDNLQTLSIAQGQDRDGHPMTLLHCFAHACALEDMCAAMGITVANLFCIHPAYATATRHALRARSPRVARLRTMQEPTSDDVAQVLLEELIVSDPAFLQECAPARAKMWELAQRSHRARAGFLGALRSAGLSPAGFWQTLRSEQESTV